LLKLGWRSLGAAAAVTMTRASGQVASNGNRALICVTLLGGHDSNNLVVPLDPQTYNLYAAGRGELALPPASLLRIESNRLKGVYGLPAQTPELALLYSGRALAIAANVGDLSRPMTKSHYLREPDAVAPDASSHIATSKMQFLPGGFVTPRWFSSLVRQTPEQFATQAFTFSNGISSSSMFGTWITGERFDNPGIVQAINAVEIGTAFPASGIGQQLLKAVKLAQAGSNLGLGNQIINCTMSGWDTHMNEMDRNARLYADLSQALYAFHQATEELRISQNVTAFTWSEFNRALAPNRTHGTAHGWGGHQLIVGDAVKGGDIYGAFPSLELGGFDDASGNGSWIPSTSTAQYAATLAKWFGVTAGEQRGIWPNLANFATGDVGFLG
jgi:uncharacterized protein (DUF1501 family)